MPFVFMSLRFVPLPGTLIEEGLGIRRHFDAVVLGMRVSLALFVLFAHGVPEKIASLVKMTTGWAPLISPISAFVPGAVCLC